MRYQHRRKTTSGYPWQPSDLLDGEVTINTVDGTLHVKTTDGTVITIQPDS